MRCPFFSLWKMAPVLLVLVLHRVIDVRKGSSSGTGTPRNAQSGSHPA